VYNIQTLNTGEVKYRLGDAVLLRNSAAYTGRGVLNEKFKGTIGYEYVSNNKNKADIKYMNELINKHIKVHSYAVPDDRELVVHLRIGDNGEASRPRGKLIDTESDFNKLVEIINLADKDSITIVTAMHSLPKPEMKHYDIVTRLYKMFEVTIKSSSNVDEDFCYLARAKKLVTTKGTFSELAGMCNPNEVYKLC